MKVLLTEFHYKKNDNKAPEHFGAALFDTIMYAALTLPSIVYLGVTKTRNFLYKKNILKSYKPKVYTISVGNLTTGGTGKTPITAEIANYLYNKGERPAILSRGYGGKLPNKEVNIISDGKIINFTAQEAGDEPFMLAQKCIGSAVLTCSSRVKSAKYAQNKLKSTKLILDDGYQHQKIKRDLNLLVVDSQKQFSNSCVLPLGALREPMSEIKRADKIIVVNKRFDDKAAKTFARYLRKKYKKPAFVCSMTPDIVYNIKDESLIDDNTPVIAFSAIAQPEQFYGLLRRFDVMGTKDFADHHIYTNEDVNELAALQERYGAKAMITTEKDAVKLKEIIADDVEIYALKLKPVLDVKAILED